MKGGGFGLPFSFGGFMKVVLTGQSGDMRETYGVQDDKLVVKYDQDVQFEMDHAARLRADEDYSKRGIKESMWHVAHIPDVVVMKWLTEEGFNALTAHPSEIAKKIASPEYAYLRTTNGRIA